MKKILIFLVSLFSLNWAMARCTAAGSAIAGKLCCDTTLCQGSVYPTLTLTGDSGDIVEWQSSPDQSTWTTVQYGSNSYPASTLTAGTIYYHVVVTCSTDTVGSPETTGVVTVTINAATSYTAASADANLADVREAVAEYSVGGRNFSGFLINSADTTQAQLNAHYFLTTSEPDLCLHAVWNNMVFTWYRDGITTTSRGATVLSSIGGMTLLQLGGTLPQNLVLLGWDIGTVPTSPNTISCLFESDNIGILEGIVTAYASTISNIQMNGCDSSTPISLRRVSTWTQSEPAIEGRGAPIVMWNGANQAGSKKATGVYYSGEEGSCTGTGPSYYYPLSSAGSILNYLRTSSSQTNAATILYKQCDQDRILSGHLIRSTPYKASNSIVSTQFIQDGISVQYRAGSFITLDDGFNSGTDFVAEIAPCQDDVTIIAAKTDDVLLPTKTEMDGKVQLQLYPTFTNSNSTVNLISNVQIENSHIAIKDMSGKELMNESMSTLYTQTPYSIKLPILSAGLYVIQIQSLITSSTFKLIIQ